VLLIRSHIRVINVDCGICVYMCGTRLLCRCH